MIETPNFYSILTANVRYDKSLSQLQKLLYSEITALADKTGICWAKNEYFANLYDKSETTISKSINTLKKKKYIDISYKKRGAQVIARAIKVCDCQKINSSIVKNDIRSVVKNDKDNNTSINNIKEIYKEKFGKFENVLLTTKEYEKLKQQFLDINKRIDDLSYYLESTGKKYKSHYATILSWERTRKNKKSGNKGIGNDEYTEL